MPIFFWKKNREIDQFAQELADNFYSQSRPETLEASLTTDRHNKKKQSKIDRQVERQLSNLLSSIQLFRTQHSLGVYGKARLHMKFTARLEELGYPTSLADQLNKFLMLNTA